MSIAHDNQTGGTAWELRTAGDQMIEARRAGDIEAEALALLRFAEGLRNSSVGVVGQVLAPIADSMKRLTDQIDRRDSADLRWRADLRDHIDARFDNRDGEVDALAAAVQEAVRGLKKFEQRMDALEKRDRDQYVESQSDRQQLNARLARIEALVANRPAERERERQATIDATIARLRQADDGAG